MKPIAVFLIYIILFNSVITDYQKVLNTINEHKSYIFNQARKMKKPYPIEIQDQLEKSIKEYEYRMLSRDEKFGEYIFNKYETLKDLIKVNKEKNKKNAFNFSNEKNEENDSNKFFNIDQLIDSQEFLPYLEKISDYLFLYKYHERRAFIIQILKTYRNEPFYYDIVKKIFQKAYIFHNKHFNSISKIIESMVYFLSTGKSISEETKKKYEYDNFDTKNNKNTKTNKKSEREKEEMFNNEFIHNLDIPESFKIEGKFKKFLNEIEEKYEISKYLNSKNHYNTFLAEILSKISNKDNLLFNELFHEYLKTAIINNNEFNEMYTKNKIKDEDVLEKLRNHMNENNLKQKNKKDLKEMEKNENENLNTNKKKENSDKIDLDDIIESIDKNKDHIKEKKVVKRVICKFSRTVQRIHSNHFKKSENW